MDKGIFNFKLKGIPATVPVIGGIIQLLYPVRAGNFEDFNTISGISMVSGIPVFIVILISVWLGFVAPGLRKKAWLFMLGMFLYVAGNSIVNETFLGILQNRNLMYAISISTKIVGLSFTTIIIFDFWAINKAMMEYFQSKRICIVHKGAIKGRAFMCSSCNVFYCQKCKDAIVKTENRCWNCKSILVKDISVHFDVKATDPLFQEFLDMKVALKQESDEGTILALLKIGGKILERYENDLLAPDLRAFISNLIETYASSGVQPSGDAFIIPESRERTDPDPHKI